MLRNRIAAFFTIWQKPKARFLSKFEHACFTAKKKPRAQERGALALTYVIAMKLVHGVTECTRAEENLRACRAPHDEACRCCVMKFRRWILPSRWQKARVAVSESRDGNTMGVWCDAFEGHRDRVVSQFCRISTPGPTDLLVRFGKIAYGTVSVRLDLTEPSTLF